MFAQKHQQSGIIHQVSIIGIANIICHRQTSFKKTAFVYSTNAVFLLEQDTGVEPAFTAWEAVVLPIYESCVLGAL